LLSVEEALGRVRDERWGPAPLIWIFCFTEKNRSIIPAEGSSSGNRKKILRAIRTAGAGSRAAMNKATILLLQEMKRRRQKIVALTSYDFTTTKLLNECGVDIVLVGDSWGW